jgi:hypothetical protein
MLELAAVFKDYAGEGPLFRDEENELDNDFKFSRLDIRNSDKHIMSELIYLFTLILID